MSTSERRPGNSRLKWDKERKAIVSERSDELARLTAALASETKARQEADRERDAWIETARQHHGNEEFYRGLVVQIGEPFGIEARTSDDGSVQDDVLALKVPELVERERKSRQEAEASCAAMVGALEKYTTDANGYCLACTGWYSGTQGDEPKNHTKDCPVRAALATLPARARGMVAAEKVAKAAEEHNRVRSISTAENLRDALANYRKNDALSRYQTETKP